MAGGTAGAIRPSRFGFLLSLVALVAFALREHFVLVTVVDIPIRGDIRDYVAYAWNLVEHGIFSSAAPSPMAPAPDSFRSPGYPWLLAIGMELFPQGSSWSSLAGWYDFVLQTQVLLGTATVVLVSLLSRQWLPAGWAIVAGLLLAVWPHHVAATGALMPEVLFAFALVVALFCFDRAWTSRRRWWFIAAGLAFGLACLVNPLVALFPPFLTGMAWLKRERAGAALLLGAFLLPMVAFALRNASLPASTTSSSGRLAINLVQGSWPHYHDAHRSYGTGAPAAVATMEQIGEETEMLLRDPRAGLSRLFDRFGNDPAGYAGWYLARKPWLLWDWNVRIGAGAFYVLEVKRSPFASNPVLRGLAVGMREANPALTALTLIGMLGLMFFGWQRDALVPAAATGALATYFTLMHVLLQAEPRYAIAYRGIEAIIVATSLAVLTNLAAGEIGKRRGAPASVS